MSYLVSCEPESFSETKWLCQYSLKVSSSIVDGFHTILMDLIYITLFLSAPSTTLHRHLRVDFMNENSIEGVGILREWLHLVDLKGCLHSPVQLLIKVIGLNEQLKEEETPIERK
ncbi:hypothetical protein PsorP6_002048 [Peronosclerospora sorghi]|uniref:Uncharacterized protein n=1 Tax=Peronosclerospora sorghi TaxID=230839 RepID=A0ACC0WS30_9STRA|nr:hypothetical protein PsorP6_002048 [Peronosclerospora sorghi]